MTTETNSTPTTDLALTIDEQWAVHGTLVARLEAAFEEYGTDATPVVAIRLVEKLEADSHEFTDFELEYLEAELDDHTQQSSTPERDRAAAESVLAKIERCAQASA